MARETEYHWIGLRRDDQSPVTGTEPIADFGKIRAYCEEVLGNSNGGDWDVIEIHILDANGQIVWSGKRFS